MFRTLESKLRIVTLFAWFGHGLGGYRGGLLFDLTGNYTLSYANAALAALAENSN